MLSAGSLMLAGRNWWAVEPGVPAVTSAVPSVRPAVAAEKAFAGGDPRPEMKRAVDSLRPLRGPRAVFRDEHEAAALEPAPSPCAAAKRPIEPAAEWTETPAAADGTDGLRLVSHAERSPAGSVVQSAVFDTAEFEGLDEVVLVAGRVGAPRSASLDNAGAQLPRLPLGGDPAARHDPPAPIQPESPRELRPIREILPFMDYDPGTETVFGTEDGPAPELEEQYRRPEPVEWTQGIYLGRAFEASLYAWEAPNLAYNPLYFEDVPLERYGHAYPCYIQPFVSVMKFNQQVIWWPYHATLEPPDKCIYPLGYYRPGECAPRLFYTPPLNAHAGLVQAGVMTGLFYIFP